MEFGESTTTPLLEEAELIKLAAVSIKDRIEIPKEAEALVEIKNGVAVVTWPTVHGSKKIANTALTGEVISVLAGS